MSQSERASSVRLLAGIVTHMGEMLPTKDDHPQDEWFLTTYQLKTLILCADSIRHELTYFENDNDQPRRPKNDE